MRDRFAALDLSSSGATLSLGRGRGASLPPDALPPAPSGATFPFPAPVEALGEALARALSGERRKPDGLLLSLPDAAFRIALVTPRVGDSRGRLDEYARWKLKSDWNLDEGDVYYDWQDLSPRWRGRPLLLLAAGRREDLDAAARVGEAASLPLALLLPRCLAAWNGWREGRGRSGASALVLKDGPAFTLLGGEGGRLRYFRSRLCEDAGERDREVGETLRHFGETEGVAAEGAADEWGEEQALRVADGLFLHPLVSGAYR